MEAIPLAVGRPAPHSDISRPELRDYANRIHNRYRGQPTTLHTLAGCLRKLKGFEDATIRARIRQRRRVVAIWKQSPVMFTGR
ncbi:hypothetical protein N9L68_01660 [bacterium]|nr:hypothetical protein [bacterium]